MVEAIYLPDVNESHLQVLAAGYKAHWAPVGLNKSGQQAREELATLWTLVERVADEGGEVPGEEAWRKDRQKMNLFFDGANRSSPCAARFE
jgi:hypothetical protein